MKRRTLATIKIDCWELGDPANRTWLAEALRMIAVELDKGEHATSPVLEIYEAEALFDKRRRWANS